MTRKEAMFLLGACPPGDLSGPMGSRELEFTEALELAAQDPELGAWLEDHRRFDAAMIAKLGSIQPPADLRARILAGGRVSRPVRWYSPQRLWAIAALVLLLVGGGIWHSVEVRGNSSMSGEVLATLGDLVSGREQFDKSSPDVAQLQRWLHNNGLPSATDLPARVRGLASVGCKTLSWNGHPISIICFHGPGGELVHLAMVESAALENPPPLGHPVFGSRDGWQMASWSQGKMSMMLVTRGPQEQLRRLLTAGLGQHRGPEAILGLLVPIAAVQFDVD